MTMKQKSALWVPLLVVLAAVGGCVSPGEMDVGLLTRYRRSMTDCGPQPRQDRTALGSLQPARGQTGPELATEPIDLSRVVETTQTYRLVGTMEDPTTRQVRKRVEARWAKKTTTYRRDPQTGELKSQETLEEKRPRLGLVDKVPRDSRDIEIYRVGERSGTPSLVLRTKHLVYLSLQDAVLRALANNLDIRVLSYDPAVSRQDMVRAAAVFDYTVYGAMSYAKDEKRRAQAYSGEITKLRNWSLGVREHTITGADWSLEWAMTRAWDDAQLTTLHTRYEPTVVLQVSQPLLRNAWPEFNLAQVRVARLNAQISEQDFRAKVEEVLTQVVVAYWTLFQARREVEIAQELLAVTNETYERVLGRVPLDATEASVRQVEASARIRQAGLIRARKNVLDVQDSLARLLADAQLNALSRYYEVVPTTAPVRRLVHVSPTEQLLTALRHNPLLEQARLAVAGSRLNVTVAQNQTLPKLDLTASTGVQGLARTMQQADDKLLNADYVSYSIGLALEYPVGNRERIANLRQREFEHTKAIVSMQNIADQIAVAVNERVRQIETTHEEILAQRAAVEASEVQLQALDDTEKIRGQLTPEFLRVKLQAQETLAGTERAEAQAIVDYNSAMAELARTTGTTLELNRVRLAMPHAAEGTWPQAAPATRAATAPTAMPAPAAQGP